MRGRRRSCGHSGIGCALSLLALACPSWASSCQPSRPSSQRRALEALALEDPPDELPRARSRRCAWKTRPTWPPSVRRAMRASLRSGSRSGSLTRQLDDGVPISAGPAPATSRPPPLTSSVKVCSGACVSVARRDDAGDRRGDADVLAALVDLELVGDLELDEPGAVGGDDDACVRGRCRAASRSRRARRCPARSAPAGSRAIVGDRDAVGHDRLDARRPRRRGGPARPGPPVPARRRASGEQPGGERGRVDGGEVGAGEVRQRPSLGHREVDERAEVVGLVGVGDEQRGGVERREGADGLARDGARDGGRQDDVGLGDAGGAQVVGQAARSALASRGETAGVSMTTIARAGPRADVRARGGAVLDGADGDVEAGRAARAARRRRRDGRSERTTTGRSEPCAYAAARPATARVLPAPAAPTSAIVRPAPPKPVWTGMRRASVWRTDLLQAAARVGANGTACETASPTTEAATAADRPRPVSAASCAVGGGGRGRAPVGGASACAGRAAPAAARAARGSRAAGGGEESSLGAERLGGSRPAGL